MSNHFKTQQEIWKYLADGGAIANATGSVIKFEDGKLNHEISCEELIKQGQCPCGGTTSYGCSVTGCPLYVEKKTKVWLWECITTSSLGNPCIYQPNEYYTEADAAEYLENYTKVPGSEREI